MPSQLARTLSSIAVMLLVGLAGIALGLGHRAPSPAQVGEPDPSSLSPQLRKTGPTQIRRVGVFAALALIVLTGGSIYAGYRFKFMQEARAIALTTGDPDFGRRLTLRYGCAGCHTIPGVPGADGKVGPSLDGLTSRVYIGGVATNNPDTLVQWIKNPQSLDPRTAMPITGISRAEARHVAAYLYTLR